MTDKQIEQALTVGTITSVLIVMILAMFQFCMKQANNSNKERKRPQQGRFFSFAVYESTPTKTGETARNKPNNPKKPNRTNTRQTAINRPNGKIKEIRQN